MNEWPFHRRVLREALWLLLLALLGAAVSWTLRAPRFPLIAEIDDYAMDLDYPVLSVDDCVARFEEGGHLFVDTRGLEDPESWIPGAFFIGAESFEADLREVFDFIYPDDPLILYGDGRLQRSAAVAARFEARGYEVAGLMRGGLEAWRRAGGELAEGGGSP